VNVMPHMHKLGTRFTASFAEGPLDGKAFLDSKGYDPDNGVVMQYDPAIDLSQGMTDEERAAQPLGGTGASFSCTWRNTLDKKIVEGVGDNEMCMMFGYAYPPEAAYSVRVHHDVQKCVFATPPTE
jgi:hypothetical protein